MPFTLERSDAMIEHLVLFKWKDGTADHEVAKAHAALAALKGKLPEIVDLSIGKNFSARGQGYQSGLVVRFRTKADLEAYAVHPEHVRAVEACIKPIADSVIAVDYEF
jgi:hypothetical protein